MNLAAILPPLRPKGQPVNTPGLLMNCLLAAARHTEFKRLAGWRGMAVCPGGGLAWTMKLRGRPGVYGLCAQEPDMPLPDGADWRAELAVHYFPAADEALLEGMSLAANLAVARPDYRERIRSFSTAPDWAAPFRMGAAHILFSRQEDALVLRLHAPDRKVCIAVDGVAADSGAWLIAPGEAEEDIPAHRIATDLFLVLCAAVSNALGAPPARYAREQTPGPVHGYTRRGQRVLCHGECAAVTDSLAWGEDAAACRILRPLGLERALAPHQAAHMPEAVASALLWKTHDLAALVPDKDYAHAFDSRPGLIVLSGFLGAGKTTYLNQLLEYHASRDELVAIIQNEVGQTGVDGKLLEGDESIVEMDEGCVCCTLAGNLARGLTLLTSRFSPKVIVLESTGLANPLNLLKELDALRPLARLDSITTLVDAATAPGLLGSSDIALDQVKAADVILLNKCDLVSEEERRALLQRLRTLNPRAHVAETVRGAINPAALYDGDPLERGLPGLLPARPGNTHAMEGFVSRRLAFCAPLEREALLKSLDRLDPAGVFRLKGIVSLAGQEHAQVVQYVAGRHELSSLGRAFDDEPFLVAIGRHLDLSPLEALQEARP